MKDIQILDGRWSIGINKNYFSDWEMILYKYSDNLKSYINFDSVIISGLNFSAFRFIFKPMEKRIEIVTKEFINKAIIFEREKYKKEHSEEIFSNVIKGIVGTMK